MIKNPGFGKKNIAIIGAGPAGLFLYKKLIDACAVQYTVHIFEGQTSYGPGMPYSHEGAGREHITNISGNEIPRLPMRVTDWVKKLPASVLNAFGIDRNNFSEYKVIPRLLFGQYLTDQFRDLLEQGAADGIPAQLHMGCRVTDIADLPATLQTRITVNGKDEMLFDAVIICTGHYWPKTLEGKIPGFFDSPYPPSKLQQQFNHAIAIKGSSLTAIDAVRTLAREHGHFEETAGGKIRYVQDNVSPKFSIQMYSIKGLLPGIRFHLEDPQLSHESMLTEEEIQQHMKDNDGFLSLDFIFEKDFKEPLKEKDPALYAHIKDMKLEAFATGMMRRREKMDPFVLFRKEYEEAKISIKKKSPVHWKELLAALSFAMNYPAKHFSAEDMLRLQKTLMPLISIVIAFVPQSSCEELMAMHDAGTLEVIAVEPDSDIKTGKKGKMQYHYTDEEGRKHARPYLTYIDCTGQPHLWIQDFPFTGLVKHHAVSQAQLPFRDPNKARTLKKTNKHIVCSNHGCSLHVPGIAINDDFRVIGKDNTANPRVYAMAVPFIGGYNPDYSGLDFCDEASSRIVADLMQQLPGED